MNPEEREELARLLPSPGEPVLTSDRHDLLEDHLMREFTQEVQEVQEVQEIATAPGSRDLAPRRRFAIIAVPLATAAAVAAAVVVGTGGSETPTTDQEAVDLLNRIATVAAAKKSLTVRDDQYVYIRTQGSLEITDVEDSGTQIYRRSDWTAVNGKRPGLARITVLSGPNLPGHRVPKGTPEDMRLSPDPNVSTYRELQALPTDPDALLKKVYDDTKDKDSINRGAALEMIGDMLDDATLLPEVDAALYRAAAKIPGVSVVENAKDLAGRPGIGLSFKGGDDRDTWVFDKESLNYLGSDEVALLGAGVVDKVGETPGN
ncbi:CU044_5270 family protein [Streptomyces sp. NPDC001530]|uniref:CU044_5270 family protein n=1 Tax=Streptomyces sp. NPDC001530 TaxID=3364582 RepID=UPI0036AE7638